MHILRRAGEVLRWPALPPRLEGLVRTRASSADRTAGAACPRPPPCPTAVARTRPDAAPPRPRRRALRCRLRFRWRHAAAYAALLDDLEQTDVARAADVRCRTARRRNRRTSARNLFTVLLTEQGHGNRNPASPGTPSDARPAASVAPHLGVDQVLDAAQLRGKSPAENPKSRSAGDRARPARPFCCTWSPRTLRSAACSRCVAEWLSTVALRRPASARRDGAAAEVLPCQRPTWPWEYPASLTVADGEFPKRRGQPHPRSPHLATRLGVEGACDRGSSVASCRRRVPPAGSHRARCQPGSQTRHPDRRSRQTVCGGNCWIASYRQRAPQLNWFAARRVSRCCFHRRFEAGHTTARPRSRDVGGEVHRESVGVVEAEGVHAGIIAPRARSDVLEHLHALLRGLVSVLPRPGAPARRYRVCH